MSVFDTWDNHIRDDHNNDRDDEDDDTSIKRDYDIDHIYDRERIETIQEQIDSMSEDDDTIDQLPVNKTIQAQVVNSSSGCSISTLIIFFSCSLIMKKRFYHKDSVNYQLLQSIYNLSHRYHRYPIRTIEQRCRLTTLKKSPIISKNQMNLLKRCSVQCHR